MSEKKRLIENLASLLLLQVSYYIFPIITFPYLVRTLGIEKYGLLTFALAFIQYFVSIVDYGFNLSATRDISIHRDKPEIVSKIFCGVYVVKFVLLVLCFGVLLLLTHFVPKFQNHSQLYILTFMAVLGNFIFPVWLFTGIEKIKFIAIINITVRVLITICIFLFVRNENDLEIAALLQSSGVVVAGIISLFSLLWIYPIFLNMPSIEELLEVTKTGWSVFVTLFSSTLVINSNMFILGLFADSSTLGRYAIADKIIRIFMYLCGPISNAIFPHVGRLFSQSKETAIRFLRKTLIWGTLSFGLVVLGILIFADIVVEAVSGTRIPEAGTYLRIMSFIPLSIFIDNIYGTQTLLNIKKDKQFMLSVLVPGLLSVISSLLFVPVWKGYASSLIMLLSELLILVMMIYFTRRNNIYIIAEDWM